MIYEIPHIESFGSDWGNLKIQWETVHLPPQRSAGNCGITNFVFLDIHWLNYIKTMNTPEAWQWMIGETGTIITGIKNKKKLDARENKARFPVIAIGGNQLMGTDIQKGYARLWGMNSIDYSITPQLFPVYWHRIWCRTKIRKAISPPHDTPRGIAFLPILDVSVFARSKPLAAGALYFEVPPIQEKVRE